MSVKALKTQLVAAIAMVLVACIALGSSTYAWFAMNAEVTAGDLEIRVKSNNTFLLINGTNTAGVGNSAHTFTAAKVALYPSRPFLNESNDTTGLGTTAVTTLAAAETPGNWYTAQSNDQTSWGTGGSVDAVGAKTKNANILNADDENAATLYDFSNYVLKKTVYLTLASGSTPANNLKVVGNMVAVDTYNVTGDATPNAAKTYYTTADDVNYASVTGASLGAAFNSGTVYYEKANTYAPVRVLIVTDNDTVAILDKDTTSAVNLYSGAAASATNIDITSSGVHQVDIYMYYDGTDSAVRTDNAVNLGGAKIDLVFSVDVNEA